MTLAVVTSHGELTLEQTPHLAIGSSAQVCMAAFDLIPHGLHFCQAVDLLPVLCELGSHGLSLLYLSCSEERLCRNAVKVPVIQTPCAQTG